MSATAIYAASNHQEAILTIQRGLLLSTLLHSLQLFYTGMQLQLLLCQSVGLLSQCMRICN